MTKIVIRLARYSDLPSLYDLDKQITFEFFKPLYEKGYSHLDTGKKADYFLREELKIDRHWFEHVAKNQQKERLYCAWDENKGQASGLSLFRQINKEELELVLLLVRADYRRQGIGKKLVQQALSSFSNIKRCHTYLFRFHNDKALKFYSKLGFVQCGLGPRDRYNLYGVSFQDMYFYYNYDCDRAVKIK